MYAFISFIYCHFLVLAQIIILKNCANSYKKQEIESYLFDSISCFLFSLTNICVK